MRRLLVVLALVNPLVIGGTAHAQTAERRPPSNRCCSDKVYDAKGKILGDLIIYDTYHRVSWSTVRYTVKGGDTVALLVSPWSIMSDLMPGGSNVLFTTTNCTGNDALAIYGNYPQLMKRQAVVLNTGTYPQFFPTDAWLWVSDPLPLPYTIPPGTVFHSQWDNNACSNYPAPGYTPAGFIGGAVWVHKVENLLAKYARPFYVP